MIDEKDPNDEAPETAEPADTAPQADRSDEPTNGEVSDRDLDEAAGGWKVYQ